MTNPQVSIIRQFNEANLSDTTVPHNLSRTFGVTDDT